MTIFYLREFAVPNNPFVGFPVSQLVKEFIVGTERGVTTKL